MNEVILLHGTASQRAMVTEIVDRSRPLLALPDDFVIEFNDLGTTVFGETVLQRRGKRHHIILNSRLTEAELFLPTIHELIHLDQMHTGMLLSGSSGVYVWDNVAYVAKSLSYDEYLQLPFEVDAYTRQAEIARLLLDPL